MCMDLMGVDHPGFTTANCQVLQALLIEREITQHLQHRMLIEMNNGTTVAILRLLIDHDFVQGEGREKEHPPRPHGVLLMIDRDDTETFFHIQYFQTLMPVVVTHRIGEQSTKRRNSIV